MSPVDQIADLLRAARTSLGLSQKTLATRAGVSPRLWAEVERGERPNVSLATALRMLSEVGITVRLTDPLSKSHDLKDGPGAAGARATVRRATWGGAQLRLDQEGVGKPRGRGGPNQVAAVGFLSEQGYAVARGPAVATGQARRRPASGRMVGDRGATRGRR